MLFGGEMTKKQRKKLVRKIAKGKAIIACIDGELVTLLR